MNEKDPNLWSAALDFLSQNRLMMFTGVSAFIISLWSSLNDGKSWARSIFGGIICVIIAFAVLEVMKSSGIQGNWLPVVGIFVGFIGAERFRDGVLNAWETRKQNVLKSKKP
ncbi:phage holin family protein [Edaphovirga cremea]|uniref:phage holin family protein n=1 Tax=Edaphovirga cremea TaxID=2267246 RepID=UPI000DEEF699|nr:phage holin family protein [Edaphovirga cremea]